MKSSLYQLVTKTKTQGEEKNHSNFSKVCDGPNSLPKPKRKKTKRQKGTQKTQQKSVMVQN